MNTFGNIFRLTTFGESHGPAIGGVIDGMPAGVEVNMEVLKQEMARRRPGQTSLMSTRKETDEVEILSGVFEGKTTGCPIGFVIRNNDQRSTDYDLIKDTYRPSHADFTYEKKYGIRDYRGGGRASARETACRVVGGAFAKMVLDSLNISVKAEISQIGSVVLQGNEEEKQAKIDETIALLKSKGDSIGGIISCVVKNCPAGLGEPVYGKLHAALGAAMLSINAVKGFDVGDGFEGVGMTGSEQNDEFYVENGQIRTRTNHSGGIQGGISNGEDIRFRVLFKPVPTIMQPQKTVNRDGEEITLMPKGRHDVCVLPRAIPVVEAMTAMTILDYYLMNELSTIKQ